MSIARSALRGTGVAPTVLGYGAAQAGNLYQQTSDEETAAAVDAAWAAGIRYFDTAPHYGLGLSERRIGAALRDKPRDELVLSTKVGRLLVPSDDRSGRRDPEGFDVPSNHVRRWDFSRDGVLRSLEDSLARLGLDRVDVVYLHDPDEHWVQASREAVPALVDLRDQGVVGAIGAGMNQSTMLARFVQECDVDVVMCAGRYTLLEQPAAADLLPAALERGVGVVVAGVYNSGLLAREAPSSSMHYDYAAVPPALLERARAIAEVCSAHGVTLPEAALAFVRRHPAVVSTVVGLRTPAQVAETITRSAVTVPDALWGALARAGLLAEHLAPIEG